ncbi:MAG: hypothetical protein D6791_15265, partial [Chloroflexi bacterium]
LIILALSLTVLFFCCLTLLCVTGLVFIGNLNDRGSSPAAMIPTAPVDVELTPPPRTPVPRVTATPVPATPEPRPEHGLLETEALLESVIVPPNDPRDLAMRLRPEVGEIPEVVNEQPPNYEEGDVLTFWVSNSDTDENWQIEAVLVVKSEHLYMWVEQGKDIDEGDLRRAAEFFDKHIYPTNRAFFGSEWSPGIDNDPRLHVLHASGLGDTVAGYFSSADEASHLINPFSNEKEMFYINIDNNRPGTDFYNGTLAHEFQHMIHWHQDLNESTWLDEGAAELAMQLNGLERSSGFRPDQVFAQNPDIQLNAWPDPSDADTYPHYGNSYLFLNYFLSRFGEEATQALIANPANSMTSVDLTLKDLGLDLTADDVFADWVVANWLDDPELDEGRWGYPDYDPDKMQAAERHRHLPAEGQGEVHQYATDYITVRAAGDVQIDFLGVPVNRLAATDAYSGSWAWWSHRVNLSDPRLTLPVDLSGVDSATLRYRTWYDLEEFWDYAYVEVSTDGGKTWTLLETDRTTRENPQGNAFGPGYTGFSGDGEPAWVLEEVDLTPYVGQEVLIRFEYITDTAVTRSGMFIDDVEIPEIGYFNDFESGPGDWVSEGWLLTNNRLRQRWLVQVIEQRDDGTVQVHRMNVAPDGRGQLVLRDVSNNHALVMAISALAPVTVETASYQYLITKLD